MTIDVDVFVQGFKDGYSGESPLLSSDEALKILMEIQEEQEHNNSRRKTKWQQKTKKPARLSSQKT